MKNFVIFSQDEEALIDALPQNISAEIVPLTVGTIHTDYFKLIVSDGKHRYTAGLYNERLDAEKNLKALRKTLKKACHGKNNFDGLQVAQPIDGEISALELLDELEYSSRRIIKGGDDDDETPFY